MLLYIAMFAFFASNSYSFMQNKASSRITHFVLAEQSPGDWFNDRLSVDDIQTMWKSSGAPMKAFGKLGQGKALMTVGSKGIGPNTINSLTELLKQHETVRVKVSSNTIDTTKLSSDIMSSDKMKGLADLLAVKSREFMVGRKGVKPGKSIP